MDPLCPLPRLSTNNEHDNGNEDDPPFPVNPGVHEDDGIQPRDVQRRKHNEEDNGNGEEEEAVPPQMVPPRADPPAAPVEEGPAEVDELPGEEQEDPRHGRVGRGAGAKDDVARRRVGVVAVGAQVAVAEGEDDGGEGAEDAASHEDAVDDHVEHEFGGEDAVAEL